MHFISVARNLTLRCYVQKNSPRKIPWAVSSNKNRLLLFFGIDDLFTVVEAAFLADFMRFFEFMAMRALHQRGSRSLEIRKSCIRSLFGLFRLRYRHFIYTSSPYLLLTHDRLTNYIIFTFLCQLFFRAFPSILKNPHASCNLRKKHAYIARP